MRWSGRAFYEIARYFIEAVFELNRIVFGSSEEGGNYFFFLGIGLITAIGTWVNFGRFFSFWNSVALESLIALVGLELGLIS